MVHRYVQDNGHRLTIMQVNHMIKEIYFYSWPWIQQLFCDRRIMYGCGHSYGFTNSVDSIGLLVCDSMHAISGAPVLYYRSFGIVSTLSRKG